MSLDVLVNRKLNGFSLNASFQSTGGILGILGASGCGKSMTLKCIAGIEAPDNGKININDRTLYDSSAAVNLRPQKRRIGYLFQNYALFPNMTASENIACALSHIPKPDRRPRVTDLLKRFHLQELASRYPSQLSGGQQQRVALARILAYEPDALLLDEPFSALDDYLKEQLQVELLNLLEDYRGDVVIVTHSRDEVYRLCDHLMIMDQGECKEFGKTQQLFKKPDLYSTARLTGCKNFSLAKRVGRNRIFASDWGIELDCDDDISDDISHIGVRAHNFIPAASDDEKNSFAVKPERQFESPFEWNILFSTDTGKRPLWWKAPKESYDGRAPKYLKIPPDKILLLRSD